MFRSFVFRQCLKCEGKAGIESIPYSISVDEIDAIINRYSPFPQDWTLNTDDWIRKDFF